MSSQKEKLVNPLRLIIIITLIFLGSLLMAISFFILFYTFFPVLKDEVRYVFVNKIKDKKIVPVNKEFGIVIPKIEANARVVKNVDPYNEKIYQSALTKGVAHAAGSSLPGYIGNTFIFAHSSGDWYQANRFNSIFYLLHKLEKKDVIEMYYDNEKFIYEVTEKKIVDPNNVKFLEANNTVKSTVTLMTCWPPGTTLQRLIVIGELKK